MKVTSTPPQQPKVETQPQQAAIQAQQRAQTLAKPAAQVAEQPKPAAAAQNPAHLGKNVDTKA